LQKEAGVEKRRTKDLTETREGIEILSKKKKRGRSKKDALRASIKRASGLYSNVMGASKKV